MPEKRNLIDENGRWIRDSDSFSQKIDIQNLRGVMHRSITIEEGTKALFLQGGEYMGELCPGVYDLGNITHTLGTLNLDTRATVILVESGNISHEVHIPSERLLSKDGKSIEITMTLHIRVDDPLEFFRNFQRGKNRITFIEIIGGIMADIIANSRYIISKYNSEELYANREVDSQIKSELEYALSPVFKDFGLKLIRIRGILVETIMDHFLEPDIPEIDSIGFEPVERENSYTDKCNAIIDVVPNSAKKWVKCARDLHELFDEFD